MRTRIAVAVVIVGLATLVRPSSAEACSCGGTHSSATALKGADLVFVGTVSKVDVRNRRNADGSVSLVAGIEAPVWTLEIGHMFKGPATRQIVIVGEGNCDEPFKVGETWLVYAGNRDGRVSTTVCTRTRLRSDAGQDLAYLEGIEQRRQQGIVFGDVLRRVVGADDGRPAMRALFEPLQVIAVGEGRRVEVTTDKWGPYQLVLPPGDFEIWVERAGRAVSPRQKVRVEHGSDIRLVLGAEYKD